MASELDELLRQPGRLCYGPTNLATAFPHGGVSLGPVRDVVAEPGAETEELTEEAFGIEVVEALERGEVWGITATLRGPSPAVMGLFMSGTATGATTGETSLVFPAAVETAGLRKSDRAIALLFSPYDTLNGHFVLFPRALPIVDAAARMALSLEIPRELAVVFRATRRTSDTRAVFWGRGEDVTL